MIVEISTSPSPDVRPSAFGNSRIMVAVVPSSFAAEPTPAKATAAESALSDGHDLNACRRLRPGRRTARGWRLNLLAVLVEELD